MSELKRFDLFADTTTYPMHGSMEECVDGDYVLYDEVEKTIKQLRKEAHDKHCQLRAELAMATDAANKGDRARHEIQAVIDERDDLRADKVEMCHQKHRLSEENQQLRAEVVVKNNIIDSLLVVAAKDATWWAAARDCIPSTEEVDQ